MTSPRHLLPATLANNDEVSSRLQALASVYDTLKPSDDDPEWKDPSYKLEQKLAGEVRLKALNQLNHLLGTTNEH